MEIKLQAQSRVKNEKLEKDFMAAVVYGQGSENLILKIKINNFIKAYEAAGESNLIDLEIDSSKNIKVLIKEIQKNPIKGFFIHVDFYLVDMSKEISTEIPLIFVGESKAIKELGALLVKNIDEVSVECLPADLVDHIDVDISVLAGMNDIIKVRDLIVPSGIKILNNPLDAVATVSEPQADDAPQASAVKDVAATVAVEKKEDKKS